MLRYVTSLGNSGHLAGITIPLKKKSQKPFSSIYTTIRKLMVEMLVEEIQSIFIENNEFDRGDMSILLIFSEFSAVSVFRWKE